MGTYFDARQNKTVSVPDVDPNASGYSQGVIDFANLTGGSYEQAAAALGEFRQPAPDRAPNAPISDQQANFNYIDYLKKNPNAGTTAQDAWNDYQRTGNPATFNLSSINTAPTDLSKLKTDDNGTPYSDTPGHVGYMYQYQDASGKTVNQWMPSAFDFSGAKFDGSNTYTMPSGEKIGYNFGNNTISTYDPSYKTLIADQNQVAPGSGGQTYAKAKGNATFQGFNLDPKALDYGEYLIDPTTRQYYLDGSGNPVYVQHQGSNGGFEDWLTTNGWMLPLALATAGAGIELGGGLSAAEGALDTSAIAAGGAGGGGAFVPTAGSSFALDSGLGAAGGFGLNAGAPTVGAASPSGIMATQSAAGLGGSGTGIIEGLTPSSIGMGGTTGAGSLTGIAGSEAAAGLGGANLGTGLTAEQLAQYENPTSSSTSLNDLNNARKLAQALTSKSGSQLTGAAQNLATGQTGVGMAIPALLRGNQTPFVQTAQQPIRNTSPDLASLANLLKQG